MFAVEGLIRCLAHYFINHVGQVLGMMPTKLTVEPGTAPQGFWASGSCCTAPFKELIQATLVAKDHIKEAVEKAGTATDFFAAAGRRLGGILTWPSDPRLKIVLRRVPSPPGFEGLPFYAFRWNARAWRAYGLRGAAVGPLSTDVRRWLPAAVHRDAHTKFDHVDWLALVRKGRAALAAAGRRRPHGRAARTGARPARARGPHTRAGRGSIGSRRR